MRGGHRFGTSQPGKTEFPQNWDDNKVIYDISDVATDPNSSWGAPQSNGNIPITGSRDGIDIKVIYDPNNDRIVTEFPTNTPKNPE